MFNAVNILEALKNYIRTRGGQSAANNIAEAVNDLNSIPQGSGGDIPDEITNAIETHGMGWIDEEEVEGFNIQWDGNTEGLESLAGRFFKISDKVYTEDELVGANGELVMDNVTYKGTVSLFIPEEGNDEDSVPMRSYDIGGDVPERFSFTQSIIVVLEDAELEDVIIHKGTYFYGIADVGYTSRLYKEATTEEVVHQIDQKYIPQGSGGGPMVVTVTIDGETDTITADKTYDELNNALLSGISILAKVETDSTEHEYSGSVSNAVCKMPAGGGHYMICFIAGLSGLIVCTDTNEWGISG